MSSAQFKPVVALEAEGFLVRRASSSARATFTITFRRDSFPTRFVAPPRWDAKGRATQRWEADHASLEWVEGLLERGVDVVWASRYQQYTNVYFAEYLGLPPFPIAALDDGQPHATEAEWKAHQLADDSYEDRPLLWINSELVPSGRHLLEGLRRPAMRALTLTQYVPEELAVPDQLLARMDEFIELTSTEEGQDELRWVRARFLAQRLPKGFTEDHLMKKWKLIYQRLEGVLDGRSGLAAPLASYAIDHIGELDLRTVAELREEWGLASDPAAEALWPLLQA